MAKKQTVIIEIDGGLVTRIRLSEGLEQLIHFEIRDYDLPDIAMDEDTFLDENNESYVLVETIWEAI